jgi:F0F1-type ATP synthase delta subunit
MKYEPHHFARAFADMYHGMDDKDRKQLLKRFITVLAHHGMLRHSHEIIKAIHEQLVVRAGGRLIRIEFARPPSDDLLHVAARFLSKKDLVETAANPALHAGMRVTINGTKELDMSLGRILNDMFRVTKSL